MNFLRCQRCTSARIGWAIRPRAVAGGHSIDSPEPIYGLVAIGLVDPLRVIRNNTARAGDKIVLTKRLGVGIYSAALEGQELAAPLYQEIMQSMTQLNAVGAEMRGIAGVHAMTDVTGFGLWLEPRFASKTTWNNASVIGARGGAGAPHYS